MLLPFGGRAYQHKSAEAFFAEEQSRRGLAKKMATELEAVKDFFDAEVEHQQVGCVGTYLYFASTEGVYHPPTVNSTCHNSGREHTMTQ